MGIGAHTEADDFAQYLSVAGGRVFPVLEHQHAGALAEGKSASIGGKRPAQHRERRHAWLPRRGAALRRIRPRCHLPWQRGFARCEPSRTPGRWRDSKRSRRLKSCRRDHECRIRAKCGSRPRWTWCEESSAARREEVFPGTAADNLLLLRIDRPCWYRSLRRNDRPSSAFKREAALRHGFTSRDYRKLGEALQHQKVLLGKVIGGVKSQASAPFGTCREENPGSRRGAMPALTGSQASPAFR